MSIEACVLFSHNRDLDTCHDVKDSFFKHTSLGKPGTHSSVYHLLPYSHQSGMMLWLGFKMADGMRWLCVKDTLLNAARGRGNSVEGISLILDYLLVYLN